MRRDQCNKFASYDDSTEPEVDVDLADDGSFSGQTEACTNCGASLVEDESADEDLWEMEYYTDGARDDYGSYD
jgi:hypothetical protein